MDQIAYRLYPIASSYCDLFWNLCSTKDSFHRHGRHMLLPLPHDFRGRVQRPLPAEDDARQSGGAGLHRPRHVRVGTVGGT